MQPGQKNHPHYPSQWPRFWPGNWKPFVEATPSVTSTLPRNQSICGRSKHNLDWRNWYSRSNDAHITLEGRLTQVIIRAETLMLHAILEIKRWQSKKNGHPRAAITFEISPTIKTQITMKDWYHRPVYPCPTMLRMQSKRRLTRLEMTKRLSSHGFGTWQRQKLETNGLEGNAAWLVVDPCPEWSGTIAWPEKA